MNIIGFRCSCGCGGTVAGVMDSGGEMDEFDRDLIVSNVRRGNVPFVVSAVGIAGLALDGCRRKQAVSP